VPGGRLVEEESVVVERTCTQAGRRRGRTRAALPLAAAFAVGIVIGTSAGGGTGTTRIPVTPAGLMLPAVPPIAGVTPSPPPGTGTYPVPWDFLASAVQSGHNGPGVAPPGANISPCTPTYGHVDPVVLVHGLGGDQNTNWQTMAPYLADLGYCVYTLTYGNNPSAPPPLDRFGGLGDMVASARALADFVQQVLHETGASAVDIVGHSEGGTMPDYYLKFLGGARYVHRFVAVSGALHGTKIADPLTTLEQVATAFGFSSQLAAGFAAYCDACSQFAPASAYMAELDRPTTATCPYDGADVTGVDYTSLATRFDELVHPPTSGFLDPRCGNTHDILVQDQCPTDVADHVDIVSDPVAVEDVANALDPAHATPVRCAVVPPVVG
jgi:triacylglycerol lipase